MAKAVLYLEEDYRKELTLRPHPVLGPGSINVGTIAGASSPILFRMPAAWADRRLLPGERMPPRPSPAQGTQGKGGKGSDHYRRMRNVQRWKPPAITLGQILDGTAAATKGTGRDYFCDAAVIASAELVRSWGQARLTKPIRSMNGSVLLPWRPAGNPFGSSCPNYSIEMEPS